MWVFTPQSWISTFIHLYCSPQSHGQLTSEVLNLQKKQNNNNWIVVSINGTTPDDQRGGRREIMRKEREGSNQGTCIKEHGQSQGGLNVKGGGWVGQGE